MVPVGVPTCVPLRKTRYPVTPDVTCPVTVGSVLAVHVRSICVVLIAEAESPVGMVGAVVSGAGVTVTVAESFAEPPAPVQLTEYAVVTDGVTASEPETAPLVEKPLPVQLVAFVLLHVSVEELPKTIDAGVAVSVAVGRGGACVVALAEFESTETFPAASTARTVYE